MRLGSLIMRDSSQENLEEITVKARKTALREANKLREHHEQKLLKLRNTHKGNYSSNNNTISNYNNGCDNSKWVVNMSDRQLSVDEIKILQKGLNFAVTPNKIPVSKILSEVEVSIKNLDKSDKDLIRAQVCNITKNFTKIKTNITSQEKKALTSLRNDHSVVILKADKGNCTVILNTTEYESKMNDLLLDPTTYEEIKKDSVKKTERSMNAKLLKLKREGKIDESDYFRIRSTDGVIPRIYGLVKIHKNNYPLRPIVSMVGSPLYNVSKFLAKIISPLVGNTSRNVRNSYEFCKFLDSCRWSHDEVMVSFDVISLFTKIPVNLAIEVLKARLLDDSELSTRTKLNVDEIIDLVSFCLFHNDFVFRGRYFHQVFGCPMGSPLSVISANLVMEYIETKIFAKNEYNVRYWKRFIDDVWTILPIHKIDDFLNFINSIENSIKFTYEIENNCSLPFLDMFVSRDANGSFKTKIYRKPTHTNRYLNFQSNHPFCQKMSVARSLFDRADKLSTDSEDKCREFKFIRDVLNCNNYPEHVLRRVRCVRSHTDQDKNKSVQNHVSYATLPYIKTYSERIARVLNKYNIKTYYKPFNKIEDILGLPKDPIEPSRKCGVVYEIGCADCDKVYVGQTNNSLDTRKGQHQAALRSFQCEKSALAHHAVTEAHSIDWAGARVITRQAKWRQRVIEEAFFTQVKRDLALNRCDEFLPNVYKALT